LEGGDRGGYERVGEVALRPRDEGGFAEEGVGCVAGGVKGVESVGDEDDGTVRLSAMSRVNGKGLTYRRRQLKIPTTVALLEKEVCSPYTKKTTMPMIATSVMISNAQMICQRRN
jgi:hypothetical protein